MHAPNPVEPLYLSQMLLKIMLAHLQSVYPQEGCGLLAGHNGRATHLYAIPNRLASATAFEMAPQEMVAAMLHLEAAGDALLAIYHSHPAGPERPSSTDVARHAYPDALQLIVSLRQRSRPRVRAFRIQNGLVRPVNLLITAETE
ncbi:MAG: M67 family metallopeptidase [Anaerolineales bacterium]|nr:M67 family metallopeptidase [Anaerolineales bacterium]